MIMKTKKELFEAAKTGPNIEYNTLLQILEAVTDQRNITIACILEDDGGDIEVMKDEMKRIYLEEVKDKLERIKKLEEKNG